MNSNEKIKVWEEILNLADNENKIKFSYSGVAVIDFRKMKDKIINDLVEKSEKYDLILKKSSEGMIIQLDN